MNLGRSPSIAMDTQTDSRTVLLTVVNFPTPNIGGHGRVVLELLKASRYGKTMPSFELKAMFQSQLVDSYEEALELVKSRELKSGKERVQNRTTAKNLVAQHVPAVANLAFRRHLSSISRALKRISNSEQTRLIHSHEFITAQMAFEACPSIPLILTSHYKGSGVTEHFLPMNPHYAGNLMEVYLRQLEQQAFKNASIVTFPSEGARKLLEEAYPRLLEGKDVRIIHNGIDLSFIDSVEPDSRLQSKYGFEDKNLLVCVASYVQEKGLQYLIDAIDHLEASVRKGVRLLLVGDGYLRADIEKAIQQKGLAGSISAIGSLPHFEVIQLVKMADGFVLPSLVSVFDLAILEAMAANTPIVTTSVGGNLEMLDTQSAVLVTPADSETLAAAIDAILTRPQLGPELAKQARQRVENRFSFGGMLSKYYALYEELVAAA